MNSLFQSRISVFTPIMLMTLFLISSNSLHAQVVTGADTLKKVSGVWEYYDFTSAKAFAIADTATYTPDIWGSSNEGVNFGKEFSSIIPGKRVLFLGTGDIDTVKTVPEWTNAAPWVDTSWDFTHGTQGAPISSGQLWVVYTSEGLYTVMQIDELPGGNFGDSFSFKYKYMSEGGTTLDETNLNGTSSDQIAGSTTSNSGNGFDLSSTTSGELEDAGDYMPDFVFVNNEGVNFGNEGSTSLSSTGRRFLLLGTGNIDTLKSVPARTDAAPWVTVSYDFSDGTGGQPISVGQLWGIYTREGNYGAIEITALPGGNFGSSFDYKYKYQPDGTRFFEQSESEEQDPVLSITIRSGNEQTADLSTEASDPIVVLVTNDSGEVVSGETVNFEITNDPIGVNEEGTVTPSDVSDASGLAEATVTVGDKEGDYTIKATLASDETKFVEFTITAEEVISGPQPTTLVITGGQNQVTVLGDTIATSLEVVVIDDIGEPMNGITVTFEEQIIPGGAESGSFFTPDGISVTQVETSNNRAYMDYSLGDTQGDYIIKAYLADYSEVDSVLFTISGELVKSPLNFSVNAGTEMVDLSWDKMDGAKEYTIYRALNDDNPASASLLATIEGNSFTDDNVVGGETYFYRLFSADRFGNESEVGAGPLSATPKVAGDVVAGTSTTMSGNGFDLSSTTSGELEDAGGYLPDFVFVNNEGVNFGNEGSTSLSSTGRRFLLLGEGNLDTLKSVPTHSDSAPWVTVSYDFSDGTGGQPIAVGQLWGIYTREGKYAAIEITALPGGNFGSSFDFNYKYQPDGSRFFEESEFQDPDPVLSIAIEGGNNQTADLSSQPENPIVVLVTNDSGEVVSGETVNFEITSDPIGVNEEGTVTPSDVSDASGLAEATVTVGDKEGDYTIKATLASDNTKFVEFIITAEEEVTGPQPTTLVITGGQNQVTVLGDTIATSLEVVVIDDIGEPMNGITVTFEEETIPDGAVSGSFFTLDGINVNQATTFNNRAYMDYSLGDKQGDYLIKAYLDNYPAVDSVVFTISGELVKAPMNFTANAQSGVIDLMWDAVEGAKEYNIYKALNDDNPASASLLATISGNVSMDDNVTPGETYFYRVFSVDAFGNESELGAGPVSATPVVVGDVVAGTATIVKDEGAWQFFDFSTQSVSNQEENGGFIADFRGTSNEGVNFGGELASSIQDKRVILLNGDGLESVSSIPAWTNEEPWINTTWDFSNGTGGQPISVGQLWGVYTSEGHYAAMEITEVPEAFGTSFSFKYKYQPNSSNQFEEVEPLIPSALLKVSGDEQIGNPEKALTQPLMVQVVDENETPVEGISVNFAVTKLPEAAMSWGLSANSVITNSEGQARVILTLGDKLGEYEVTASVDELESVVFSSSAVEIPAPDAVTLLEVRDGFWANSLMPLWSQSNSKNFLRYRIYMSTEGGELMLVDSTRTGNLFTQDTAKTVNDLTALQDYSFAVTVVNADLQESELSNMLTNFPKPVPDQPKDVVATAGDGAVQLSWVANDSAYFDYYYVYSGLDGFGVFANDTLYGYKNTSLVISGLENEKTYQFYVTAVNRFGKESSFPEKITATPVSAYVEEQTTLPNLVNGISSWADTDNDGDLDLLITGQEGESDPQTLLLLNDGSGDLSNSNQSIEGVINSTVFWFDIDQNGFVDLVLSGESSDGAVTKIYLNNEGAFTDSEFVLPGFEDGMLAPADYDRDGDIDFLVAGTVDGNPKTSLIKNLGSGTFEPVLYGFVGFSNAAASWGDVNADEKPDVLITGSDADGAIDAILYLNLGNDTFEEAESSFQGVLNGTVAFTDFDLDTDQDILITGYTDNAGSNLFTGFYENKGTTFDLFYSANSNSTPKQMAGAVSKSRAVVGDYDNDGDPDVLINAKGEASIFNNNRGEIAEEKLDVTGAGSVTWADYDGDGDLDIVVSGSSSKILSNNTAIQNTAPSVPENLMFTTVMDTVKLTWGTSTDAQTPSKSLTYNVRIGTAPGASDILSANADLSTGKLRTQIGGNAGYNTSLSLQGLPNGTYYWQVQSVDNGFLGSMFSQEQQFDVTLSTVSNEGELEVPVTISLAQNYPNPFNPSTTISYSLQSPGNVNVQIFDITGRLVQVLVNGRKTAGEHSVSFNASNLASGLYIYRLQTAGKIITKKMTLIK